MTIQSIAPPTANAFADDDGIVLLDVPPHSVVIVRDLSPGVRQLMRDRLARLCYGDSEVDSDPEYYSFGRTAREFLRRYEGQAETTKIGMVGELLAHLVIEHLFLDLTNFSVYLNKEERSIKKGFDLTFVEASENRIWYAEVKTTLSGSATAVKRARGQLSLASSDLALKFVSRDRRSLWDSAVTDATLTLLGSERLSVKQLLRKDSLAAEASTLSKVNVVLIGAVIHPLGEDEINPATLAAELSTLAPNASFEHIRFVAIQKGTREKILQFFVDESAP